MLRKTLETGPEKWKEEKQGVSKTEAVGRASRGRGRGKRAWLQSLMDIPVELFDEVCLLHRDLAETLKFSYP